MRNFQRGSTIYKQTAGKCLREAVAFPLTVCGSRSLRSCWSGADIHRMTGSRQGAKPEKDGLPDFQVAFLVALLPKVPLRYFRRK